MIELSAQMNELTIDASIGIRKEARFLEMAFFFSRFHLLYKWEEIVISTHCATAIDLTDHSRGFLRLNCTIGLGFSKRVY